MPVCNAIIERNATHTAHYNARYGPSPSISRQERLWYCLSSWLILQIGWLAEWGRIGSPGTVRQAAPFPTVDLAQEALARQNEERITQRTQLRYCIVNALLCKPSLAKQLL